MDLVKILMCVCIVETIVASNDFIFYVATHQYVIDEAFGVGG